MLVRNGRIYAGTSGQGVFVSDDLGSTWLGFNQGLVGGIFNTQLDDRGSGGARRQPVRGDGRRRRRLGPQPRGRRDVESLRRADRGHDGSDHERHRRQRHATAVIARAATARSSSGTGAPRTGRSRSSTMWDSQPAWAAITAAWTGHGWVVGSNGGLFRSPSGQEPWTPDGPESRHHCSTCRSPLGAGIVFAQTWASEAASVIAFSGDDGVTWQILETMNRRVHLQAGHRRRRTNSTPAASMASGISSIDTVSVPGDRGAGALRFALAGAQPIHDDVRFRFRAARSRPRHHPRCSTSPAGEPPAASTSRGRQARTRCRGAHRDLGPGVYHARLTAGGRREVLRLVRVR